MLEQTSDYDIRPEKNFTWWFGFIRFLIVHLLCGFAFIVGFEWTDVLVSLGLYFLLIFFVTAGYHRYFSHRTYKTSRVMQFVLAFGAMMTAQKGVMWWASHHRHHHKYSDTPEDVHSVRQGGFWWAHMGWIFHPRWFDTDQSRVKDLARYPELVWLDENKFVPPLLFALACFLLGGWTGVTVWFLWTIVFCWHGTFTINSLAHVYGSRRYETEDDSRNNFWLALLTMGEGWHNNHHHYQASVNQGWFWWEIDLTYYVLLAMEKVGLVWDLRRPPEHVVNDRKHPVQEAIAAFKVAAAGVKDEAILNIQELRQSVGESVDGVSNRWDQARADAHASWEERKRRLEGSVEEASGRWDDAMVQWSLRWDEQVEEIMDRAEARLEELEQSVVDADKRARKAMAQIRSAAEAHMEEIRAAARQATLELESELASAP